MNNPIEKKPQDLLAKILIENVSNREPNKLNDILLAPSSSSALPKKENNHEIANLVQIIKDTKLDENFEITKTMDANESKRILGNLFN